MDGEQNGSQEATQGAQDPQDKGQEQQETQQQGQQQVEGGNAPDYEKQIAERDERIATLEAQVAEAAKNVETAKAPRGEITELKQTSADERIDFKLQLTGCRNVKTARAVLADYEGDIDKLKEGEPWMFAKNYTSIIDEVYQRAGVSNALNSGHRMVRAGHNAKEIMIPKIEVTGLGDYTHNMGYKTGSITYEFETKTFNYDRGIHLFADVMDVEEAGVFDCFVEAGAEPQHTQVAPGADAFTFAQIDSHTSATVDEEDLSEASISSRHLFITPTLKGVVTTTSVPEGRRGLLASERICTIVKYQGLSFTPWDSITEPTHQQNLTHATFATNMDLCSYLNLQYLFYSCTNLAGISRLANLVGVRSLRFTFASVAVGQLDLRGFDPSTLIDLRYTFSGCIKLVTIYADASWTLPTSNLTGAQCFYNCQKLVGGNGTT